MAWPVIFANLTNPTLAQLDQNFNAAQPAGNYAALAGSASQTFTVANAATAAEAVALGQSLAGATMQNVTASRSFGVIYTNSTPRAIAVNVTASTSSVGGNLNATVAGYTMEQNWGYASGVPVSANFMVPPGATYELTASAASLGTWVEIR